MIGNSCEIEVNPSPELYRSMQPPIDLFEVVRASLGGWFGLLPAYSNGLYYQGFPNIQAFLAHEKADGFWVLQFRGGVAVYVRGTSGVAPAVFTSKANAEKFISDVEALQ